MPEKISDIYYPESDNLSLKSEPEVKKEVFTRRPPKKTKKKNFFLLLFLGGIVLLILLVFTTFLLAKAQIELWPETKNFDLEERIEINTTKDVSDFEAKIFPGKIFEITREESDEFSSSGKALQEGKAKGVIQVYNAYSTENQVLVANTRFISADGKLFRSLKRVVIPGGKYDANGKLVPGFLDVEVVAAEAGEEYNIGPSTFSIPGFAGTPKYTSFYGKSFSPMKGGFRGQTPQVTQEDLNLAEKVLSEKILENGKDVLKKQIPPDFILVEDAYKSEIIEFLPGVKAGDTVAVFNPRAKGSLKAIAFKRSDLENFVKGLAISRVSQDESFSLEGFWIESKIQEQSFKLDYRVYSIDWEKGVMILDLLFSAKIYPVAEETLLKKALVGKSLKEVESSLSSQPQIRKVQVRLRPFWLFKVPQNLNKIKIIYNF